MVVETENLTKLYGAKTGCEEICLSVGEGQIFGFLGPNGAGKSTLIKMLVGLLFPTSGSARLLGRPLGDLGARRKIGFLPENFRYQQWLTGWELLKLHASLYRMDGPESERRIPEVLELVGLQGQADRRVGGYSKGMQQRIGLALAILPNPDLIFLDEPASALDPIGRREVREIMLNLRRSGKTVFLNSHLLSEVEMICDEVAIINRGRIVAGGRLADLLACSVEVVMEIGGISPEILDRLSTLGRMLAVDGPRVRLALESRDKIPATARAIVETGGLLYRIEPRQNSLEDLFMDLVQKEGSAC